MSATVEPREQPVQDPGAAMAQDNKTTAVHAEDDEVEVRANPPSTQPSGINLLRLEKTKAEHSAHHRVRLESLPPHKDLEASAPDVDKRAAAPLARALLDQAYAFMATTAPTQLKMRAATAARDARRGSRGSSSRVEVRRGDVEGEHWVWRSSCHRDAAAGGTASWREFRRGLFGMSHSSLEQQYTPNVQKANHVCQWDVGDVGAWTEVAMGVFEMHHKIPTPGMADRVFTILVVSGRALYARREFFTVTVPLDPLPAGAARAAHWSGDRPEAAKVVHGAYVAVERVRCVREDEWEADVANGVPGARTARSAGAKKKKKKGGKAPASQGADGEHNGVGEAPQYVYWDMATTADAGGKVPAVLQKMGLASHVVVDVGLLLEWTRKSREE